MERKKTPAEWSGSSPVQRERDGERLREKSVKTAICSSHVVLWLSSLHFKDNTSLHLWGKNEVSFKFSQKCFRISLQSRPIFKVQAFWNGVSWGWKGSNYSSVKWLFNMSNMFYQVSSFTNRIQLTINFAFKRHLCFLTDQTDDKLFVFLICKSLWIKASAKWVNINVCSQLMIKYPEIPLTFEKLTVI